MRRPLSAANIWFGFLEAAGFRPLDQGRLPASCAGVLVLIEGRPSAAWLGSRRKRSRMI